jgi:hypothetical protein
MVVVAPTWPLPLGPAFTVRIDIHYDDPSFQGYQYRLDYDAAVLAVDAVTQLQPDGLTLCVAPDLSTPGTVKSGCAALSPVPVPFDETVETLQMHCVGPGTTSLHLVSLAEDPHYGSTVLGGDGPPTILIDDSVTCEDLPCVDRLGDTACDDPVNDPDDDGCSTSEEEAMGFEPSLWYDFYDVPVPARSDAEGANGTRNRAVNMQDVLAVLFYVGTSDDGGPNANGVDYDTIKGVDLDGDTDNDVPPPLHDIEEGVKYDRSPSAEPNPPWGAGPPDGAVNMQDVLAVIAQIGLACTGTP